MPLAFIHADNASHLVFGATAAPTADAARLAHDLQRVSRGGDMHVVT